MRTPAARLVTTIAIALLLIACQATGPVASSPSPLAATPSGTTTATSSSVPSGAPPASASPSGGANAWRLVALGDSDTTGSGAPTGKGWVDDYAELIRQGQGREVSVSNLAENGKSSAQLLDDVRSVQSVRDAIAAADIVVVGIGGADLNAGDDALAAGPCKGTSCYAPTIAAFKTNIDAIAAEIMSIRAGKPTVLRAVTPSNGLTGAEDVIPPFVSSIATDVGVYTAKGLRDQICTAMTAHGGQCIDVLTAFNGPRGDADAYKTGLMNKVECCYPSEKGQKLMADLLYATRLAPLVP
jgi:lysophospholipase L1-like esterase